MNTLKTKFNNYLSKYGILIFIIVTLLMILFRVPFWDETHSFNIARLNLKEIFYLTRIEGHTCLWYLILKPFSSLNLYPYSMFIINWLFCIGSIYVLYKYSPFTPIQKTLITFSTPFLYYFAVVARCYSIGILFLFLICAFYKKRFKKPLLFSSLILLLANTSVMGLVGAFYLGLIYIFEIILKYKNKTFSKKNLIGVLLISILCTVLILSQFIGLRQTQAENALNFINTILNYVILPNATSILPFLAHIVASISFYYFGFIAFKNTKKGFFFIASTYITLTYIFLVVYNGSHWNHYFYFIYFITLVWIYKKNILKNKFSKILFTILLIFFLFPKAILETGKMDLIYASKSNIIAKEIVSNPKYRNAKLYTLDWWSDIYPGTSIYLEKQGIFIYDWHNRNKSSFEGLKNIFSLENEIIDFDIFYNNMDKNSYLISTNLFYKQKYKSLSVYSREDGSFIFKTEKNTYLLKKIEKLNDTDVIVFKVVKI